MKRLKSLILAFALTVSMAACWAVPAVQAEDPDDGAAAETTSQAAPIVEGNLYLKVSSITFSLVGESDDIYLGLVPRELVSWESEDPGIVSVEDGVLTANGVGTTTIWATYDDRQISCKAGCLARTQEELEQLAPEILSTPKRLPPEVDLDKPCTYFDDSVIIGDSIAYFLWQYESLNDQLGQISFITRHGISLYGLVAHFKNLYYGGYEINIENILAEVDASRIYIMIGCLDYQADTHSLLLMENWEKLFDIIAENASDKEIVIVSNIPSFTTETKPTEFNTRWEEATPKIKQLTAQRGHGYLDLGYYIQDHYGRMPEIYCKDEFHINNEGNLVWVKLLRFYAQFESEGGSLK